MRLRLQDFFDQGGAEEVTVEQEAPPSRENPGLICEDPPGQGLFAGLAGRDGGAEQGPGRAHRDHHGADHRIGCAARWFPWWKLLFRAALLRTTRAPFNARGSPVTYAAFVTGLAWMTSWQAAQTTRVLRRLVAMNVAHAGWPDPACPRLASLRTWCTSTLLGSPHSSHRWVRSRWINSFRG